MPKIAPYEQNALESCLTCCLMMISRHYGKKMKPSKKLELKILRAGLKFDKKVYDIGQLHEMARRYGLDFDYFVENLKAFHYTRKLPFSKRIIIHNKKVDSQFIKEILENGPIILPLDPYGLFDEDHYSHYILLAGRKGRFFSVIDPWTGEEKQVEQRLLSKGIRRLRTIGFSPVLIARRHQ